MRQVLAGGEAVAPDRMREALTAVASAGTETRFLNGYGPTESTTFALTHWIAAAPRRPLRADRPADRGHARVYVLDAGCGRCPLGVPGELYIGRRRAGPRLPRPAAT